MGGTLPPTLTPFEPFTPTVLPPFDAQEADGNLTPEMLEYLAHGLDMPKTTKKVRTFETGATRDVDMSKYDYEGFLSPTVLEEFGKYMHSHRVQPDGVLRDADNWQKGIPKKVYVKSAWRHFMQFWKLHRGLPTTDEKGKAVTMEEAICALLFNLMGYLHEFQKERTKHESNLRCAQDSGSPGTMVSEPSHP